MTTKPASLLVNPREQQQSKKIAFLFLFNHTVDYTHYNKHAQQVGNTKSKVLYFIQVVKHVSGQKN